MTQKDCLPVDWSRVERIRVGGVTHFVMIAADNAGLLIGYLLRRDSDGDLDFQTVPGEDPSSRRLFLFSGDLVSRRTRLQQDLHTGAWITRS